MSSHRHSILLYRAQSSSEASLKSVGNFMILDNQALLTRLLSKDPKQRDAFEVRSIATYLESLKFIQKIKEETSDETVSELARCVSLENFKAGEVLARQRVFNEGERGSKFYIVMSGAVSFYISATKSEGSAKPSPLFKVGDAKAGAAFGELALLHDKPRAATIECDEDCIFGVIDKEDYTRIIARYTQRALTMKLNFLSSLPYFSDWRIHNLAKLTYYFKEVPAAMHKVIFRENDPVDFVYIIVEGEFRLLQTIKQVDDGPLQKKKFTKMHIATLGAGELVGITEVLEKRPRRHSCVCASSKGKLIKISADVT